MKGTLFSAGSSSMIKTTIILALLCYFQKINGQNQVYDDFEGNHQVHYGSKTGTLYTDFKNPYPDSINKSAHCGKYVRNAKHQYDYIKIKPNGKFSDVTAYDSYLGTAPAIKMKVLTNAPAGTLIEIQLGKVSLTSYPDGTHSQYQAYTSVSNQWEEVVFRFSQLPTGSETSATEINQIILMFDPNSSSRYTFYFDDLSGPPVIPDNNIVSDHKKNKNEK